MVAIKPMAERKAVSLSGELHLLILTLDGIRELAERLNESMFHDGALPLSIASNLALVKERLQLIDRVVRGALDPRLLRCPGNEAFVPISDGGDILLQDWSDKKTAAQLRREWRAAKRRLRKAKHGR